jgi:hypothetical protein
MIGGKATVEDLASRQLPHSAEIEPLRQAPALARGRRLSCEM